jgi:hypothetical protein
VTGPPTEVSHPSPRSLKTIRGVRAQLVELYREGKANLIEPPLLGKLVHCLNVLQSMDQGVALEQRILALEQRLAAVKANGHDRRPEMRA